MPERTLVVGASGFLGRTVVELLVERDAEREDDEALEVVATGRTAAPPAFPRASRARRRLFAERVRWRALDAPAEDALARLLDEEEPRRVVCCAALASLAACAADPARARAVNVDLPAALARRCAAAGARLVHVSTDLVFGASAPPAAGFHERSEPEPLSEYGRSKLAGERAVQEHDPRALVVRLPLLLGDSGGRERGASDALLAAVARGEQPVLFADEWRSPLDVHSAARALIELATRERAGLLHVAGPDRLTRHDLGLLVLCAQGLRAREAASLVRAGTRASAGVAHERPADVCLDSSLARSFLAAELPPVALALARQRERSLDDEIERRR